MNSVKEFSGELCSANGDSELSTESPVHVQGHHGKG